MVELHHFKKQTKAIVCNESQLRLIQKIKSQSATLIPGLNQLDPIHCKSITITI